MLSLAKICASGDVLYDGHVYIEERDRGRISLTEVPLALMSSCLCALVPTHIREIAKLDSTIAPPAPRMYRNSEEAITANETRATSQRLVNISSAAAKVVVAMVFACCIRLR